MKSLLIEDNAGDADLLRALLNGLAEPVELAVSDSLRDGLALARRRQFDLALLDLSLPDSRGLDTVRKAVAALDDVPIIVLTGLKDERTGLESLRAGAQDYLIKGAVTADMLGRAVRYAVERHHAQRALRQSAEVFRTTCQLMALLNSPNHTHELLQSITGFLQNWTGCEAVGVRLREGDDFPYFETRSFPPEFVQAENYLCQRDLNGQVVRDGAGHPVFECMCGNVLSGRFDPTLPFFTAKGSFWTNSTTKLLAGTTEADRQGHTRNRCNGEGYESVALVRLRCGDETLGLLQLNDRAAGRFTAELIEFLESAANEIAVALAHRKAQAALGESERLYRSLFNDLKKAQRVAHVGSWAWHVSTNRVEWSDEMFRIFGIDPAGFSGDLADVIARAIHPDDRAAVEQANLAVIKTRQAPPMEYRVVWPDQTVHTLWAEPGELLCDDAGRPAVLTGIVQDITERKALEAEVVLRQRQLNAFFQGATAGLALLDKGLRFLQINDTLAEMNGHSAEAHLGKTVMEIIPDIAPAVEPILRKVLATGEPALNVEVAGQTAGQPGAQRHWVESFFPTRGADGSVAGVGAIVVEITPRKRAEEALAARTRDMELLSESATRLLEPMPGGRIFDYAAAQLERAAGRAVVVLNEYNRETDELVVKAVVGPAEKLRGAAAILGRDPVGLAFAGARGARPNMLKGSLAKVPGGVRELVFDQLPPAVCERLEKELNAGDAYAMPFVLGDDFLGTVAVIADRAEGLRNQGLIEALANQIGLALKRQRAEDALKQSESRYRAVVENVSLGISLIGPDHRVIAANAAQSRLSGRPLYSLDGQQCFRVYRGLEQVCADCPGFRAMASGLPAEVQHTGVRGDGSTFTAHVRAFPLRGPDGEVSSFIEVVEDITERKLLESQLLQAQKMEAIGRLAGGIAHDFRNQLTIIKGYGEMLLQDRLVVGEGVDMLNEVLQAVGRSAEMTGQLLAFSRQETLRPELYDLTELVRDIAKVLARVLGEDIRQGLLFDPRPCTAKVDGTQFHQAINNLVSNARDAMPGGGDLTLRTFRTRTDAAFARRHPDAKPGWYAVVEVTDTGTGMDAATRSKIFDPFFTTKGVGQGTGLGLPMVYGFVKQSGGAIEVDSEPGRGARFRLYFPLAEGQPVAPAAAPPADPAPGGAETVLVVEDEPAVRKLLIATLRGMGYRVLEADSGQAALDLVRSESSLGILITDRVMPGLSGDALIDQARAARPGIPVLFVSGYAGSDDLVRRGGDEATGLLVKPFDKGRLAREVRRLLDGR